MKRVHGVMRNMKTLRGLGLLAGFLLCVISQTHAALIGVGGNATNWPGLPNLYSQGLTISYSAGSELFTVTGTTSDYFDVQTNDNFVVDDYDAFTPGSFTLSATVDHTGALLSGTVTIAAAAGVYDPTYTTQIYGPGTLLQGNLISFGSRDGADYSRFDCEFTISGGELADVYGGIGKTAGTAIDTEDFSFNGSFNADFSSNGQGVADTLMLVPEPEPQILVILSALGLCWVARRRVLLRKS